MTFDFDTLSENCDGDRALMRRVIDLFLTDHERQIESLHTAFRERDVERLFSVAHSIRGSAGNFGALQTRAAAQAVEALCRAGRVDEAGPQVEALVLSLRALAQALRAETL